MNQTAALGRRSLFDVQLPRQPYPGLRPFEKEEWPIFFGREKNTAEAVDRLIERQFLVLHGDSGCGKSSLIRAGVMPRLERDHARGGATWRTASMLPRNAPLRNFAAALASLENEKLDPARITQFRRILNLGQSAAAQLAGHIRRGERDYVCVLVDQFEEVFHLAAQGELDEAQQFIDVLVGFQKAPPDGLHFVLTMRSEYIGSCAHFNELPEAVNDRLFLLPRMDRLSLMRAICEPARLYGGTIDADFAEQIVGDAGQSQDQLPLMQHGVMLLYQRELAAGSAERRPWRLKLEDYRASGGLRHLLSDHANGVVDSVLAQQPEGKERDDARRIVERTFTALSDIDADGRPVRRPRQLSELVARTGANLETLLGVIEPLCVDGVSFLKICGSRPVRENELVDVSHEALIRNWDQLQRWIAEENRFVAWRDQIWKEYSEWDAIRSWNGNPAAIETLPLQTMQTLRDRPGAASALADNALLIGHRLDRAKYWAFERPSDIDPRIRDYIDASDARSRDDRPGARSAPPHAPEAPTAETVRARVFVAYSRRDLEFADRLIDALRQRGVDVAFDRGDISSGEDWAQRLLALIRQADAAVFILSASALASKVTAWELEQAENLGKRLAPIWIGEFNLAILPRSLAALNVLRFPEGNTYHPDFGEAVDRLVADISTDLDWLREHTRLGELAVRWDQRDRDQDLLLRGSELQSAVEWRSRRPASAPEMTALQKAFLDESEHYEAQRRDVERQQLQEMAAAQRARADALQRAEQATRRTSRRTRAGLVGALSLSIVATGLAYYANMQHSVAVEQRVRAEASAAAVRQAQSEAESAMLRAEEAEKARTELTLLVEQTVAVPSSGPGNATFLSDLVVEMKADGRTMRVTRELTFRDSTGKLWTVPVGTDVDGSSIPRRLWTVIGSPFTGGLGRASVLLDYFSQQRKHPRQDVNRMFLDALLASGVPTEKARLIFVAVERFGPTW